MRAVRYDQFGGPDVLRVVDVDAPHAAAGTIRIKVSAAGVNGVDWKIRSGHMREVFDVPLPAGTGIDAAGVVDEVGEGVDGVQVGDAVFGSGSETLAEHAVLREWAIMPEGLPFDEAAGYPIPVETAIRILDQVGVQPGETLLVSGASGGVGSAVLQLARERGITVIGTASERNHEYLRAFGAAPTTYGEGLVERVARLAPQGVDAALDIAGSGVIPECIALTGEPSKVLSIADFGAPAHGAQVSGQSGDRAAALREAARLYAEGRFRLPVDRTFGLAEAAEAHAWSAAGHAAGRVVVTVVS